MRPTTNQYDSMLIIESRFYVLSYVALFMENQSSEEPEVGYSCNKNAKKKQERLCEISDTMMDNQPF